MLFFVATFLILVFILNSYLLNRKYANLPPGPWRLPFFGNFFDLKDMYKVEWSIRNKRKYGPVFTMWVFGRPVVFLADYKVLWDTLIKEADHWIGRPRNTWIYEDTLKGANGIILADGDLWREQRRFVLKTFRDFGLGQNVMEKKVLLEADRLAQAIKDELDISCGMEQTLELDVSPFILLAVTNTITNLLIGDTYHVTSPDFKRITSIVLAYSEFLASIKAVIVQEFPWSKRVPFVNQYLLKEYNHLKEDLINFLKGQVDMKKAQFQFDQEPTDYVSAYLTEMRKREQSGIPLGSFTEWQLIATMSDLWAAGLEQVTSALRFLVLLLSVHPDVQNRARQEILSTLGHDRQPCSTDRPNLPYTNAVIQELLRWTNILPQNVNRVVKEDTVICGYTLPANTVVVPQISAVLADHNIYPNPSRFDPTRFLNSDGAYVHRPELIPFSMGKRTCLGEGLARLQLFLIAVTLLQQFEFSTPLKHTPTIVPVYSFVLCPQPYKVVVRKI